jgi:nucleotidyltransferase/DNA polymerase involved in DNA repair
MPPTKAIGHLDADCFYVSAERVRDGFLKGKPVGVLGNQGACVIAKSYEMKEAGVKTGEPIWDAIKKCPDGVYVKRDFRWYEVLSHRLLDAMRTFSPEVEYYSIDEFFFRAVALPGRTLQQTAEAMRDHILHTVGVPVTVGIGRSKTLAKLISDTAKPFGALALLDREAECRLLRRMPVTEISGIAARRAATLAAYGIRTCMELADARRTLVSQVITATGEAIWWELNGEAIAPIHTERPPHKMLSRGGSIGKATADRERIWGFVVRNLERLIEELEFHRVWAGAITLLLQCDDGIEGGAHEELLSPTTRFDLLLDALRRGFARAWLSGVRVVRMHLIASKLRRPGFVQRGLFEPPEEPARSVAQLKREINEHLGRFALRSGATLTLNDIYRDHEQGYDICDIRGKICF